MAVEQTDHSRSARRNAVGAVAGGAAAAAEEEKTEFDVILKAAGAKKQIGSTRLNSSHAT